MDENKICALTRKNICDFFSAVLFVGGVFLVGMFLPYAQNAIPVIAEKLTFRFLSASRFNAIFGKYKLTLVLAYLFFFLFWICKKKMKFNRFETWAMWCLSVLICSCFFVKCALMVANVFSSTVKANIFNEVRSFADYMVTQAFLEGKNPYTYSALLEGNPHLYTLLLPLIASIPCKVFGISIIASNNALNIMFVFGAAICLWMILRDLFEKKWQVLLFFIILLYAMTFSSMFGVLIFTHRPDSLSIFIYSFLFLALYKWPKKIFLCACLTVALFFTKTFMAFVAFPIMLYYAVAFGRKYFALYFLECAGLAIFLFVTISVCFPLYWAQNVFLLADIVHTSFLQAFANVRLVCSQYFFSFVLLSFAFVFLMVANCERTIKNFFLAIFLVLKKDFLLLPLTCFVFSVVCMLYFSGNGVDGVKYCRAMMGPPLLLFSVYAFKFILSSVNKNKIFIPAGLCVTLLALSIIQVYSNFSFINFNSYYIGECERLQNDIESFNDGETPIFLGFTANSYVLANINKRQNVWYDNGMIEYCARKFKGKGFRGGVKKFFGVDKVCDACNLYVRNVNKMVSQKRFGVVVFPKALEHIINMKTLEDNYILYKTYQCKDQVGEWTMEFYIQRL